MRQVAAEAALEVHLASADDPGIQDRAWLQAQWEAGRILARSDGGRALLILDEIQKIGSWSEIVKRLWDEDEGTGLDLRVVILGSAPLLVARGLTESLAGRFELIRLGHWSFAEMTSAFGWDLERFLFFGGYPGAAPLIDDVARWRGYIRDSLIETTLSRDIMLLTRVDKPAPSAICSAWAATIPARRCRTRSWSDSSPTLATPRPWLTISGSSAARVS